jgi:hypothetical protein
LVNFASGLFDRLLAVSGTPIAINMPEHFLEGMKAQPFRRNHPQNQWLQWFCNPSAETTGEVHRGQSARAGYIYVALKTKPTWM